MNVRILYRNGTVAEHRTEPLDERLAEMEARRMLEDGLATLVRLEPVGERANLPNTGRNTEAGRHGRCKIWNFRGR